MPTPVRVFMPGSIAVTSACSPGRWRHRAVVMTAAAAVIVSSIPLYKIVRQEYIPTNVDEAEFDVNVTAPEGISLATMDKVMQTSKPRSGRCRWSACCSATPAADSWAASIREPATFASRPTTNAFFLWDGSGTRRSEAGHGSLLRDVTSQRDVMQQVRARVCQVYRSARLGAQRAVVQHRQRQLGHRLRAARPGFESPRQLRRSICASAPKTSASSTPTQR